MAQSTYQLFDACKPLLLAGQPLAVKVSQTLREPNDPQSDRLKTTGPNTVNLVIEGPQFRLSPDDIAGVYPAPGSEESPDEFVPHVALNRRTLPWERVGPGDRTWRALLLFKESELRPAGTATSSPGPIVETTTVGAVKDEDPTTYDRLRNQLHASDDTKIDVVYVRNSVLLPVVPMYTELNALCHMRRATDATGQVKDTATVICNRLPDAGTGEAPPEIHTALLVSMEHADDIYGKMAKAEEMDKSTALVVLHHWSFKPSKGGDFEQVMKAIRIRPNGGVLRFGNVPKPLQGGGFEALVDGDGYLVEPLEHAGKGAAVVKYRGPLVPFTPDPRSEGFAIRAAPEELDAEHSDYSYAAAFEIGRLLTLHDPALLEDLADLRKVLEPIDVPLASDPRPAILQKYEWVSYPGDWFREPWAAGFDPQGQLLPNMIKGATELGVEIGEVDHTGVEETLGGQIDVIIDFLEQMTTPPGPVVSQIDFGKMTSESLDQQFESP